MRFSHVMVAAVTALGALASPIGAFARDPVLQVCTERWEPRCVFGPNGSYSCTYFLVATDCEDIPPNP